MLGAALVMAALAAGCSSSGSSPTTLPQISTTPTNSASQAPTTDPKAAAVAVVRQYFDAKNSAVADMDPTPLARIETSGCSCRRFLRSIRATARKKQTYFGTSRVRSLNLTASTMAKANVLAVYDTSRGGSKDAEGRILFIGPARRNVTALFTVVLVDRDWLIEDIANISPGRPE
jgi:hypothetical protein